MQHWKARLQGRRGPSPLQPYRELRRLWGKSAVDVEGAGVVYRLAPAVAAAGVAAAVLARAGRRSRRPTWASATTRSRSLGLLALARFALAAAVVGRRRTASR